MSPAGEQAPLQGRLEIELAPAAVGADSSGAVRAPFDGTVTAVSYVPVAAVTGANTNSRTVSVVNHGQDGSGSTSVASLAFVSAVNAAAYDEKDITLSGTPANLTVVAGDILEGRSLHIGTGIAEPGGTLFVTLARS